MEFLLGPETGCKQKDVTWETADDCPTVAHLTLVWDRTRVE